MKKKASEHSAELGASCPIMKNAIFPKSISLIEHCSHCMESGQTSVVYQRNILSHNSYAQKF